MTDDQNMPDENSLGSNPNIIKENVTQPLTADSNLHGQQITSEKNETENMEVHHHSHSSHGSKTWKAYFWEFLMLFLAVFCGFLAEYYLEHRIEKERGKQYMESFYEDLKSDTARLDTLIHLETKKVAALNKLNSCYDSLSQNIQPVALLDIVKNSLTNNAFLMDGRTLRQLNNAGGFRLLLREDADSIIGYEKFGNALEEYQSSIYQQSQDNLRNTFSEIVDFISYTQLYSDISNNPVPDATEIKTPLIFTNDKSLLNKYFNQLFQYLRVIVQHRNRLEKTKLKATDLLRYFRNKYHLN